MAAVDAWIRVRRSWLFGTTPPSQVRRSLFGDIDHESTSRFLKDELEKQRQKDKEKWNFDFLNDVPLADTGEGYQWTPVRTHDGDDAPKMREMEDTTPREDKNGGDNTAVTSHETSKDVTHELPLRQTQIPDYMRKRKSSSPGLKNGMTSSAEPPIKMARRSSA